MTMKTEFLVRIWAVTLVLVSLLLAHDVKRAWHWRTAFVGAMLVITSIVGFGPAKLAITKLLGRRGSKT
jgi:hypothetical protein